jgi:hypothetical protein
MRSGFLIPLWLARGLVASTQRTPRLVEKYVQQLQKQLVHSGLAKRLFALELSATQQGWSTSLQDDYHDIQAAHLKLRRQIELKLRKLRMGGIPWSPKLQGFRNAIKLWSMILRKRKGIKVSNTRIRRLMAKTGIWNAFSADGVGAEMNVKTAHRLYRAAKKDASVWRDEFLHSLATATAKKNGTSCDHELKQLTRVEGQKTQARNVKRMLKKLGNPSTTKLYFTCVGTNQVLIQDTVTLRPAEWLTDNILHYFTHSVKRIFKIKNSVLVFFSSYFLTLLFNEGHSNSDLENKFCYKNVATWWSKKRTRLKTLLQEVKTLVFFRNEGRMHGVTYIIFQDLKIIEEFDSMGSSDTNILKGLCRWLFIEYQRIGIHLDPKKWRLYQTRQSTPRQRNGYDCGFFFILVALHAGLRLDLNNISQEHVTRARCQMLLHLLQISRADDNDDDVLVNLADDLDDNDEASAHIDGMSEDDNVEEVDANAAQNDDVNDDNSDAAQDNMDNEGDANAGEDNDGQDDNVNEGPGEGASNNDDDQDEHHDDQGAKNGNDDDSSDKADDESGDDDDEDVDNEDANQLTFASVPEQYPSLATLYRPYG